VNRSLSIGGLGLALSLGACDSGPPDHTTEWYRQNLDVAKYRVSVCNDMSVAQRGADCSNAVEAIGLEVQHGVPKFRSLFDEKP
jgi:hypothetical protein